jgi:hypothetical protein
VSKAEKSSKASRKLSLEDAKQLMLWLMKREERREKREEGSWKGKGSKLSEDASTLRGWKAGGSCNFLPRCRQGTRGLPSLDKTHRTADEILTRLEFANVEELDSDCKHI